MTEILIDRIEERFKYPFEITSTNKISLTKRLCIYNCPNDIDNAGMLKEVIQLEATAVIPKDRGYITINDMDITIIDKEHLISSKILNLYEKPALYLTFLPELNVSTNKFDSLKTEIILETSEIGNVNSRTFISIAEKYGLITGLYNFLLEMLFKSIRDNYFEKLKMNKYDLLVNVINEIGNFPYIMSGIYLNNEKIRSGEYQGLGINIGWNDEDETALYIFEYENEIEDIERIYYTYEEMLCYLLMYHLQHMNEYSDMIAFVEQEFLNYVNHIDESKKYKINMDLNSIFERDRLRNFLINYARKENQYNIGAINFHKKHIGYSDINILKRFLSYLLGKDVLKEFLSNPQKKIGINLKNYFIDDGYNEIYKLTIDKLSINIEYYCRGMEFNGNLLVGEHGIFYGDRKSSDKYISDFITKKEAERLIQKKDKREKENIEIISKKDFLKELEIIVNAYEDIYNDNEVEKIFENFKENF